MDVSVIIVNYNTKNLAINCIKSVYASVTKYSYEVILVDNGSSDSSVETIRSLFPKVNIVENKQNVGFGKANNQAARIATGRYLYILNNDTEIDTDVIDKVITYGDLNEMVGIIGTRVVFYNGKLQKTFFRFPTLLSELIFFVVGIIKSNDWAIFHLNKYRKYQLDSAFDVDVITGCSMFVKQAVYKNTGLFNEDYFMYYEDSEFCYRVKKAGFKCVYFPMVSITHYHMGSSKQDNEFKPLTYSFSSACTYFKNVKGEAHSTFFNRICRGVWTVELILFKLLARIINQDNIKNKRNMLITLLNI